MNAKRVECGLHDDGGTPYPPQWGSHPRCHRAQVSRPPWSLVSQQPRPPSSADWRAHWIGGQFRPGLIARQFTSKIVKIPAVPLRHKNSPKYVATIGDCPGTLRQFCYFREVEFQKLHYYFNNWQSMIFSLLDRHCLIQPDLKLRFCFCAVLLYFGTTSEDIIANEDRLELSLICLLTSVTVQSVQSVQSVHVRYCCIVACSVS